MSFDQLSPPFSHLKPALGTSWHDSGGFSPPGETCLAFFEKKYEVQELGYPLVF
jgi:hypothetical protein